MALVGQFFEPDPEFTPPAVETGAETRKLSSGHRSVGAEMGGQLDLDGDVEGQFGQPHRAPGVAAGSPKTSTSKSEHPSMTAGVWLKPGPTFTIPKTLTMRSMRSRSPQLGLQRGQDREGGHPGRIPSLFERQIGADLSADDLRSVEGTMTSDVDQIVLDDAAQIVAGWRGDRRKYDSQLLESVGDHGQSLGVPGDLSRRRRARARPAQSSVRTRLRSRVQGGRWMNGVRRSVVGAEGVRIGVLSAGEGPPLLLVHGGVGQIERWDPVWDLLTPRWTVTAMDRRGRGSSGDGVGYHIEDEFGDVGAVATVPGRRGRRTGGGVRPQLRCDLHPWSGSSRRAIRADRRL